MQRRVLPLAELRAEFAISRAELRDDDRGAEDADLEPLDLAAHQMAVAENKSVFHGWPEAGIVGIVGGLAPSGPDARQRRRRLSAAGRPRRRAAAAGRHQRPVRARAGQRRVHARLETAEHGGYPLRDHLRKILDGPVVWAPGVSGAVVLSLRGGDFLFESGQDLSIGYLDHDREVVNLYLEQSFSFHVATPEAAVPLKA